MQRYDLIIVGGGLVGASLAIALKDTPLSIALIDARTSSQPDPRLFALNASSCQLLDNLGLFNQLISYASPIKQVHVSREGHFGSVRLNAHEADLAALGYVIPAENIEKVINETLHSLPHVTVYAETKLEEIKRDGEELDCFVANSAPRNDGGGVNAPRNDDGGEVNAPRHDGARNNIHTSFLIAADGSYSTVRQILNIDTITTDYQQSALVARVQLHRPHQHIAYERFNTHGAIAMLPLSHHECAMIWSADTPFVTELMNLSDEIFLQKLQKTFGYRLGRFQHIGKRFIFPLQMIQAKINHVPGVLLIGNAAHTLHPIAAQGFNLALYEVAMIAEKINEHFKKINTLTPDLFSTIAALIQTQLKTSTQLSHRLSQFCTSNSYLIDTLLQTGMAGLDLFPFVKRKFIEKILGKSGLTPRLLLEK
jgi:2-octaprenyl-6-methoxyphenol hydroxylase